MQIKKLPSWDHLNECFRYDEKTGELFWKVRPLHHFKNARIMNNWNSKNSGNIAGYLLNGYIKTLVDSSRYANHRIIWKLITKEDPPNFIDHIDGNKLNNKFINLRKATNSENCRNRSKQSNNKSGFKGVCYNKNVKKYQSYITYNGKPYHLGYFETPEEASQAYQEAAKKFHQDFAKF